MTKSSALTRQVGGQHYTRMAIQPDEFAMANGWDADAFSILKYLSRHRHKDGPKDLDKAAHFVERRQELLNPEHRVLHVITVEEYIRRNQIGTNDADLIRHLGRWVHEEGGLSPVEFMDEITELREELYGEVA